MKKSIILVFTILFCNFYICSAQNNCTDSKCLTNSIIINTGYNHNGGTVFAINQLDPYWILTDAPIGTISVNLNGPANVIETVWPVSSESTISANDRYISPFLNSQANVDNINSGRPYSFERCFCVCTGPTTKVKVNFDITVRADNAVKFFLDGVLLPGQPANLSSTNPTSVNFDNNDIDNKFQGTILLSNGRHCLRAELRNKGASTDMGLDIKGTLTTTGNELMRENCCSNSGFIVGYKYKDENCNGLKEPNEPILPNWKINLTGGGLTQTTTTDGNGYYTFSVPPGTYTVSEVMQTGWSATSPAGGSKSGIVISPSSITQVDFLNCNRPPESIGCCPSLKNLIVNPGFTTNTGINSSYQFSASAAADAVKPGQYSIVNSVEAAAICKNWIAPDHVTCSSSGKTMVVNGRTGQTGKKEIWRQTISIQKDKWYSFCGNFRNMAACCFDVKPNVDVRFSIGNGSNDMLNETISESAGCNWRVIRKQFGAGSNTSVTISVWLDESSIGDGNDVALDDFSFYEIPQATNQDVNFVQTSFVDLGNGNYTFAIQSTNPLPTSSGDCGVWYEVCEIDANGNCIPNTTVSNPPAWWSLSNYPTTINFAGYNGTSTLGSLTNPGVFSYSKSYAIRRGVFCDCLAWKDYTMKIITGPNNKIQFIDKQTGKILMEQKIKK